CATAAIGGLRSTRGESEVGKKKRTFSAGPSGRIESSADASRRIDGQTKSNDESARSAAENPIRGEAAAENTSQVAAENTLGSEAAAENESYDRLLAGRHHDPHSILGAHPATQGGVLGDVVWVMQLGVDSVHVLR